MTPRRPPGTPAASDRTPAAAEARQRVLREVRDKYGLTQAEAARFVSVTVDTWSRWERGAITIPPATFEAVLVTITAANVKAFRSNAKGNRRRRGRAVA